MAAVLSGIAGYFMYERLPDAQLLVAALGFVLFLSVLALLNSLEVVILKNKLNQIEKGLLVFENEMNSRLNAITSHSVDQNDLDRMKSQLMELSVNTEKGGKDGLNGNLVNDTKTKHNSGTANLKGAESDIETEQSKVSDLPALLKREQNGKQNKSKSSEKSAAAIKDAILELKLQPIVNLSDRSTIGFDVVAGHVEPEANTFEPIKKINGEKPDFASLSKSDLEILKSSFVMARNIRKKVPDALLFVPISGAVLSNKRVFSQFKNELNANKTLIPHCIMSIDGGLISHLSKSARSNLVDILDAGFTAALNNVPNMDIFKQLTELKYFEYCFVPYNNLGVQSGEIGLNPAVELFKASEEQDINVIISGVKKDHELMRIVDENFQFAVGEYLSPAKSPNIS